MDHSTHTRLSEAELTAETVTGATVYGPGDENVGDISDVHGSGPTMRAIIDVGGFLGIGSKSVALDTNQLDFMRDENGNVHAKSSMTKEELKNMPEHQV